MSEALAITKPRLAVQALPLGRAPLPVVELLRLKATVPAPTSRLGHDVPCPVPPRRPTVAEIQNAVAEHYRITRQDLLSDRTRRTYSKPRQVAMWLCRKLTVRSYPDIGQRFGGRDHTTVLYAFRAVEKRQQADALLRRDLDTLMDRLGGV